MSYIHLTFRSNKDWQSLSKAQALADLFAADNGFLMPQKLDNREPERFDYDADDLAKLEQLWTTDIGWVYFKTRKPHLWWLMIKKRFQESEQFNEIAAGFHERYFKKTNWLQQFTGAAKRLYSWGDIVHGYICHEEDWNSKNYLGKPTRLPSGRLASTGGLWLQEGLPGIYWANFFGPIYVSFFGRERFRTVPSYYKEELPDGGFLMLTSASPLDYDRSEVHRLQESIIDHLGRDAFFEKSRLQKHCKAPEFSFEQVASESTIETVTDDPISEIISNPHGFLNETRSLSESLNEHVDDLDYSIKSLNLLDNFILKRSYRRPKPWATARGSQLLKQLSAYYGEVLCRNLGGKWSVQRRGREALHPVVVFFLNNEEFVEYPFIRVIRLWSERQREDGLVARFFSLQSGEIAALQKWQEENLSNET